MRATTIPAQITTVEDKIAGNLNMTQVTLLGIPIIFAAICYTIFPPTFHFALYKLPLVALVIFLCVLLSLRVRNKIILQWLLVVVRFNLRPRYFIFNRNDEYLREIVLPEVKEKKFRLPSFRFLRFRKKRIENGIEIEAKSFGIADLMRMKVLIDDPNYSVSFKQNMKGGFNVALEQVKS